MRSLIGFILVFAIGLSLPFVYAQNTQDIIDFLERTEEERLQVGFNAEEAIELIRIANEVGVPFPSGTVVLKVDNNFQGTNPSSATFDSVHWFEYCVNYQDGSECGTTQRIQSSFESFTTFDNTPLFSFTDVDDPLRTVINAEIRSVSDFSGIGTDFCHDAPRWKITQTLTINGVPVDIPRQLFGTIEFNEQTHIMKNIGVKFTPQLIEKLLEDAGADLVTGDKIKWSIHGDYRYTVWKGDIIPFTAEELSMRESFDFGNFCGVTGELAFDGYGSRALVLMDFLYVSALDQIARPTTVLPDTDGDGIPDIEDQCSFTRETVNGIDDEDGCPDTDPNAPPLPFELQDADFDGIVNGDDNCTFLAENFNGIEDGDGCPDGQSIQNVFVPLGERQQIFLQGSGLEPLVTTQGLLGNVDDRQKQLLEEEGLVEDNPETNIAESMGVVVTGEDPVPVQYCNNLLTDCNVEIERVRAIVTMTTGIPLPFEPTILNLVIFFAVISVIMIIIVKFVVNKR